MLTLIFIVFKILRYFFLVTDVAVYKMFDKNLLSCLLSKLLCIFSLYFLEDLQDHFHFHLLM